MESVTSELSRGITVGVEVVGLSNNVPVVGWSSSSEELPVSH